MTDELRAKFEAWCRSKCWPIHRGGEQYDSTPTQHTWEGCQFGYASRDAEVEALKAELSEAKDGWHQANGVADLAMRHRDDAEAEVAALRREIERVNDRWFAAGCAIGTIASFSVYFLLRQWGIV